MSSPRHPRLAPPAHRHIGTRWAALALAALLLASPPALQAAEADPTQANPTLLAQLMKGIEARERPPSTGFFGLGGGAPSAADSFALLENERALRALGARANAVAPRLAELLAATQRNHSELAWTLWSVSAGATPAEVPALEQEWRSAQGALALQRLARLAATRDAAAMPALRDAQASPDLAPRMLATIALGFQRQPALGDEPAQRLAALLSDPEKPVRMAAVNGLRLLGPLARSATPQLLAFLRAGENPYGAALALAAAPIEQLLEAQPALEAVLTNPKLSDFQKKPAMDLMLRIELHREAAAAGPGATHPTPAVRPAGPRDA